MNKRVKACVRRTLFIVTLITEFCFAATVGNLIANNLIYGFKQLPQLAVALVMVGIMAILSDWLLGLEP